MEPHPEQGDHCSGSLLQSCILLIVFSRKKEKHFWGEGEGVSATAAHITNVTHRRKMYCLASLLCPYFLWEKDSLCSARARSKEQGDWSHCAQQEQGKISRGMQSQRTMGERFIGLSKGRAKELWKKDSCKSYSIMIQ